MNKIGKNTLLAVCMLSYAGIQAGSWLTPADINQSTFNSLVDAERDKAKTWISNNREDAYSIVKGLQQRGFANYSSDQLEDDLHIGMKKKNNDDNDDNDLVLIQIDQKTGPALNYIYRWYGRGSMTQLIASSHIIRNEKGGLFAYDEKNIALLKSYDCTNKLTGNADFSLYWPYKLKQKSSGDWYTDDLSTSTTRLVPISGGFDGGIAYDENGNLYTIGKIATGSRVMPSREKLKLPKKLPAYVGQPTLVKNQFCSLKKSPGIIYTDVVLKHTK